MYANFKSLSDKERKRQELIRQIEEDLRIDKLKEKAYSQAVWSSDVENNTINLIKQGLKTVALQTDETMASTPSVRTFIEDELPTGLRREVKKTVSSSAQTGPSELDLMREEDLLSDLQRHQDKIFDNKNVINRQAYIIQELMNSNEKMNKRFQVAEQQFNNLLRDNELSKREINALHKDFELGRQIYLALQQKAQTIEGERNVAIDELEKLKDMYNQGVEFYRALEMAYKSLNEETTLSLVKRDEVIEILKREQADTTAKLLELQTKHKELQTQHIDLQSKMKSQSVSKSASDRSRSSNNTPAALRQFMEKAGVSETWAATTSGKVSSRILFVIKNGRLNKRRNGEPDIDLGNPSNANHLKGLDPIFTMISLKYGLPSGTKVTDNSLYAEEAKAIRESGKLLTHEEAAQLEATMLPSRELRSLEDAAKRQRSETFYDHASPVKEVKKKLRKPKTGLVEVKDEPMIGVGLRGRGLRGSGRAANLRHIEGSASASALKYHKIGSKYIRIPDLRQNRLKLVYPSRGQLGKIIDISPKLSKLINELVFDQNINQQLYESLSISDQKLFHEILRLTHMQYQFRDALTDPLETLRAEYDKLRSQIMIGNDNPDLIRELKALAVDLYSQKLISEDEFKSIILV